MRWLIFLLLLLFAPVAQADPIDVNTATATQLEALHGIGPAKAQAIVAHREQHGPFTSVDQLDDVSGIGPATLAGIRDHVTIGGGSAAKASPSAAPTSAPASGGGAKVDINSATAAELQSLSGIGSTKATLIVEDRETNGPFGSCQDLTRVTGIGPATVASIADRCVAGGK